MAGITHATLNDLDELAAVEAACFPPAEAASRAQLADRLRHFADHFFLLREGGRIISFVDGPVTVQRDLTDELYADAACHDPAGRWQMIFGVNTLPECRRRGCAARAMRAAIEQARCEGRLGVVLTCKDALVHWYARLGFADEGVCASTHGGAVWHQMRLVFPGA